MIKDFRHKGLANFYGTGSRKGVLAHHAERLRDILAVLDAATIIGDLSAPGLRLHQLTGKRKGEWAVSVSGAWRVTFRFADGDALNVDYEQYH